MFTMIQQMKTKEKANALCNIIFSLIEDEKKYLKSFVKRATGSNGFYREKNNLQRMALKYVYRTTMYG